jgi:hypothetical protein
MLYLSSGLPLYCPGVGGGACFPVLEKFVLCRYIGKSGCLLLHPPFPENKPCQATAEEKSSSGNGGVYRFLVVFKSLIKHSVRTIGIGINDIQSDTKTSGFHGIDHVPIPDISGEIENDV